MFVDDICNNLRSRAVDAEWISLEEYNNIMRSYKAGENDTAMVAKFLEKYFLEIDDESKQVRLNTWTENLLSF